MGMRPSDLASEQQEEFLQRIREAVLLDDENAIIQLDNLWWQFFEDPTDDDVLQKNMEISVELNMKSNLTNPERDYEREDAQREIAVFEEELQRFQRAANAKAGLQSLVHQVLSLRWRADSFGNGWSEALRTEYAKKIQDWKKEAYTLADEIEVLSNIETIDECAKAIIHSVSSVQSVLSQLQRATTLLKQKNRMTSELERLIRRAKEKVAWFRARKKLNEAEVAQAGGGQNKAEKLRKEASVLIRQDWSSVFPDEEPPSLNHKTTG